MKTKRILKRSFAGFFVVGFFIISLAIASMAAAGPQDAKNIWSGRTAKYVFMFIGDGMGLQQVSAAEI
jgi:alkaline phosphatase